MTLFNTSHSFMGEPDSIQIKVSALTPNEAKQVLLAATAREFAKKDIHEGLVDATMNVAGVTTVERLMIMFDPSMVHGDIVLREEIVPSDPLGSVHTEGQRQEGSRFLSFKDARAFVHDLALKSKSEWAKYSGGSTD